MAEVCVDIDTTSWTLGQISHILPVAYHLLWQAGDEIVPTVTSVTGGHRICVENPTCDVATVLTAETILAKDAEWELEREAARLQAEQDRAEAESELEVNQVKQAKLSTIDAKIDAISNLADAKVFLKKLTRYILASRVVGGRLS